MSEFGPDGFFGPPPSGELGNPELQLPVDLQQPMREHLEDLRRRYLADGWGQRVGFGQRPAVVVVDLALWWTKPGTQMGSNLDPVVAATHQVLQAARAADVPIFYSTSEFDPPQLPTLGGNRKIRSPLGPGDAGVMEIVARLVRAVPAAPAPTAREAVHKAARFLFRRHRPALHAQHAGGGHPDRHRRQH